MLWETKNFNLFDKTQENAKSIFNMKKVDLKFVLFIYLIHYLQSNKIE